MICERCKLREATVHLTEIIRNEKTEVHLCDNCARDMGLSSHGGGFSLTVSDMMSFLDVKDMNDMNDMVDSNTCATCGWTLIDYKRTGKLGCADCYSSFKEALTPILSGYHGSTFHIGKMPLKYIEHRKSKVMLDAMRLKNVATLSLHDLENMLEVAVENENYEEAAKLRDEILKLKNQQGA